MKVDLAALLFTISALLTSSVASAVTYTYDTADRLTKVTYDNGAARTYTYDAAGNILTVATTTGSTAVVPAAGLWAIDPENNGQPGRGFQVVVQHGVMVLTFYGYKADGTAQWYLSAGALSGSNYTGTLDQYAGGTAFGATYVPARATTSAGTVNLTFSDTTHGLITLPGETPKAVSLLNFGGSGGTLPITPASGLWAIDSENNGQPGRGFQIAVQGSILVLTFYGYKPDGVAQWYLAAGQMANSRFSGSLDQYIGGTAFGAVYKPATLSTSGGTVTITFTDSTHGTITLPGETAKAVLLLNF